MLTFAEEQRLYRSIPTSFTVDDWDDQSYTYSDIPVWWANQDHDIVLPEVVLGWNARGVGKTDEQSLNQVVAYGTETEAANTTGTTSGSRVYDELVVEFSVEAELDENGVPADPRANAFANVLLDHFRFEFDQNYVPQSTDPDGRRYEPEVTGSERPVVARVTGEPTTVPGELDGDAVVRAQFTVRLHYTETNVEEVETVETVEGELRIDDGADDPDDGSSTFVID